MAASLACLSTLLTWLAVLATTRSARHWLGDHRRIGTGPDGVPRHRRGHFPVPAVQPVVLGPARRSRPTPAARPCWLSPRCWPAWNARGHGTPPGRAGRPGLLRPRRLPRGPPRSHPGHHGVAPVPLPRQRQAGGNPVGGNRARPGDGRLAVRARPPDRIRDARRASRFASCHPGHRQHAGPAARARRGLAQGRRRRRRAGRGRRRPPLAAAHRGQRRPGRRPPAPAEGRHAAGRPAPHAGLRRPAGP